jgi:hypothetical protein
MKKSSLVLALGLFCSSWAAAQVFMRPFEHAASMALGGATVALPTLHNSQTNEAQLGLATGPAILLGAALPYGLTDWQALQVQGIYTINKNSSAGLEILQSGLEGYREQRLALQYGRKLSEKFSLGGSAYLLRVAGGPEYGSAATVNVSIGILAQPLPGIWLGARLQNPIPVQLGSETTPAWLRVGAYWKASPAFGLLTEVEKDIDRPAQVKVGAEYRPVDAVRLRLGLRSQPSRASFGVGLRLKSGFFIDTAAEWHPRLGFTPAVAFAWQKS